MQKWSFSKQTFPFAILIYGATIWKWQFSDTTASRLPHPRQRLSYSWKLGSTTSFTGHLLRGKSRFSRPSQPGTWQCLHPQDNSGTVAEKNTTAVVIAAATPVGFFFVFFLNYTGRHKKKKSGFGLVIFWISTSWNDDLCWQAWSVFPGLFLNSPATIKRHFCEVSSFYYLVNVCARLQKEKIYRLDMIIYPAPIIQRYLYRHPWTVCTVYTVFIPMYLLYFITSSLLDRQQTSATVNNFHLDT